MRLNLSSPWWALTLVAVLTACGTEPTADPAAPSSSSVAPQSPTTSTAVADSTTTTEGRIGELTTTLPPANLPSDGRMMTVADALKTTLEGPAMVTGFLFFTDQGTVLADALLESFPPQPGGATIEVVGVEAASFETETEGSVTWTNQTVTISGVLDAGVLLVESENR